MDKSTLAITIVVLESGCHIRRGKSQDVGLEGLGNTCWLTQLLSTESTFRIVAGATSKGKHAWNFYKCSDCPSVRLT